MLKNLAQLEHIIGDNFYRFTCGNTAPISEIKDALFQFLKLVGQIEDQAKAQQEAQAAEQKEQAPDIAPPLEKAE